MNPYEETLLLVSEIENTKKLWEVYKTEEIRVYLEYLKELYKSKYDVDFDERQVIPYTDGDIIIITD